MYPTEVLRQSQEEQACWSGAREHGPLQTALHGGPGAQVSGRLCAVLLSKGIFSISLTGMSALSAQKNGAKLHIPECSLRFLNCNAALLTSPILSPGAQKERPPDTTTEFCCFWRHFWRSHCTNL